MNPSPWCLVVFPLVGCGIDDADETNADPRVDEAALVGTTGSFVPDDSPCGLHPADGSLPPGVIEVADLGHTSRVRPVGISSRRIVAHDDRRWIVWNRADRSQVARGAAPWCAAPPSGGCVCADPRTACDEPLIAAAPETSGRFAAGTFVVQEGSTFGLYRLADGARLGSVPGDVAAAGWSVDGAYLWTVSTRSLSAWSRAGRRLLRRPGDYSGAVVAGASRDLRVALGPAGDDVIEHVDLRSGGATVTPPFSGDFHAWFQDGERFLATTGSTAVRIYSHTAVLQELVELSAAQCTGHGQYWWCADEDLDVTVRRVGGGGTPVASYRLVPDARTAAGHLLATGSYVEGSCATSFRLVHLDASEIVESKFDLPALGVFYAKWRMDWSSYSGFVVDAAAHWAGGTEDGLLFDESSMSDPCVPPPFGCGVAADTTGAADGAAAVVVPMGRVLLLESGPGGPQARGRIEFGGCSARVALTANGASLAVVNRFCQRWLGGWGAYPEMLDRFRLLALPDLTETLVFDYGWGSTPTDLRRSPTDFALAAGGARSTEFLEFDTTPGGRHTVVDLETTEEVLEQVAYGAQVVGRIAPAGSLVAVTDGVYGGWITETDRPDPTMRIYLDDVLVGARDGFPLVWLDDGRLLVQRHDADGDLIETVVCGPDGTVLETVPLPMVGYVSLVPSLPGRILSGLDATIYDLATGAPVWTSSVPGVERAVVAGGHVLSLTPTQIVAEAY
jgi:hypothetical protein